MKQSPDQNTVLPPTVFEFLAREESDPKFPHEDPGNLVRDRLTLLVLRGVLRGNGDPVRGESGGSPSIDTESQYGLSNGRSSGMFEPSSTLKTPPSTDTVCGSAQRTIPPVSAE